ncbi:MAG: hypothetical protein KIT54_01155 [Phycisphaeraceae bacterium]|nr:hypothetical protein [Phycisphaeraceae bacterium]
MQHNASHGKGGPWACPAVRALRLGGLCVVAATGLLAAGGWAARDASPASAWAVVAMLALPAMALAALALHRAARLRRG